MAADVYRQRVQDVMVSDLVTVSADDTLDEALTLLVDNGVSVLPVITWRRQCVGVLSATDIVGLTQELGESTGELALGGERRAPFLEHLRREGFGSRKVKELMSDRIVSVTPETSLAAAARQVVQHHVHRLIVLDEEEKIIGVVSTIDILQAFADAEPDATE